MIHAIRLSSIGLKELFHIGYGEGVGFLRVLWPQMTEDFQLQNLHAELYLETDLQPMQLTKPDLIPINN